MTNYPSAPKAAWPFRLPEQMPPARVEEIRRSLEDLARQSPYGWGHAMDFGPFCMPGILGNHYLQVAGLLDDWGWWPNSLRQMVIADVGCFSGGLSMLMAARGAEKVLAIDEIPEHLTQCKTLAEIFQVRAIDCLGISLYEMPRYIPPGSLDLILLSGVLYHLSDMLVGLVALHSLLKETGVLLIESYAVETFEHSYANFGRFYAGVWWQPTGLCIQDMCEFTGFARPEVRFFMPERCLARVEKARGVRMRFKRGLNWPFPDKHDEVPRTMDRSIMAPAPLKPADE